MPRPDTYPTLTILTDVRGSHRWWCYECGRGGMSSVNFVATREKLERHAHKYHSFEVNGRGCLVVHPQKRCGSSSGNCPYHNPSEHVMREFPRHVRFDRNLLVERICPHGVGHPDPDSLAHLRERSPDLENGVHGCDGCCREGGGS